MYICQTFPCHTNGLGIIMNCSSFVGISSKKKRLGLILVVGYDGWLLWRERGGEGRQNNRGNSAWLLAWRGVLCTDDILLDTEVRSVSSDVSGANLCGNEIISSLNWGSVACQAHTLTLSVANKDSVLLSRCSFNKGSVSILFYSSSVETTRYCQWKLILLKCVPSA